MCDDIDIRPSAIWSSLETCESRRFNVQIQNLPELEAMYEHNREDLNFKAQILLDFIYKKHSYQYMSSTYGLTIKQLKKIVREYEVKIKAIKRNNRKYLNKKIKVNEECIEMIQNFLNLHKHKHFTLKDIKTYLEANFKGFDKIAVQTISKVLKSKLKFTYKRIGTAHMNFSNPDMKIKVLTNVAVIDRLQNSGYSIIYVDEFRFTTKSSKYFGWIKRGESGYVKTFISNFEINFIIGFSDQGIQGVILNTKTNNANLFRYFLYQLNMNQNDKYVIVLDNASYHKTKEIQDFWENHGVFMLTIPPYSPFL